MKDLLTAVKAGLQDTLEYIRDADIVIVPHEDFIPDAVRMPAIGIKDGPIQRVEGVSGTMEYALAVKITLWVRIMKDEASIIGIASSNTKGILDIEDDVHAFLDENLLDITGMIEAFSPSSGESMTMGDEARLLQKKTIIYRYVKEGNRP